MQFKHPELLYALFLLLIPILIHLFQLRKFQKVDFTNVAYLKKVKLQTRKSSQLKKWITLLLRLLALACIIIAFAQPFNASETALNPNKETVIYLDNSFSMQAKGENGPLLQRAIQQVYDNINGNERLSYFTNDASKKESSLEAFRADLLELDYTDKQLTPREVLLQAEQLFNKDALGDRRLVYISDFQVRESLGEIPEGIAVKAVQLKPTNTNNVSIDSVYVGSKSNDKVQLGVQVSATGETSGSVAVSLFNKNNLIAKTAADFSEKNETTITFDIENATNFKGRLTIDDPNLIYDNNFYFSINTPKKIKVLSISEASNTFLQRIFNTEDFEYSQQSFNQADYNAFPNQNFIVLNELKSIPNSLSTALVDFVEKRGNVFIIPSTDAEVTSYNSFLTQLGIGTLGQATQQEKKITQIVFSHPLYKEVFEKQVVNFQYPKVNSYFPISSNAGSALKFEDGKPFLLKNGGVSLSTAAFNSENSNFKSSPLIVPTLYNLAQQSSPMARLYYTTGRTNTFAVPVTLLQDEIVTLKDSTTSFVPVQQTKANNVLVTTTEEPKVAGIYTVSHNEENIEDISYNFSREESDLQYANLDSWEGVEVYDSISALYDTVREENTINSFWKWFAIFALLFLLLEMLVLKFYKQTS